VGERLVPASEAGPPAAVWRRDERFAFADTAWPLRSHRGSLEQGRFVSDEGTYFSRPPFAISCLMSARGRVSPSYEVITLAFQPAVVAVRTVPDPGWMGDGVEQVVGTDATGE